MKTTMAQTETTTESPGESITTSFPLGLFCNATMSGPLPKAKPGKTSSTSRKIESKIENLHPIDPQSKGWMKNSDWAINQSHRQA